MKRRYEVRHQPSGIVLAGQAAQARRFWARVRGLMWRSGWQEFDGLLIESCNSIHTCFMSFAIDVIFMDGRDRVVKVVRHIAPWRMTWIYFAATRVLELPAGTVSLSVRPGDQLELRCIS